MRSEFGKEFTVRIARIALAAYASWRRMQNRQTQLLSRYQNVGLALVRTLLSVG